MELLWLRYFEKVADYESVTKAAKHFMVPQPSMSQTIARLEDELGKKLFDRRNSKIFLNEDGKVFYQYVKTALRELDNGVTAVTTRPEHISGPLKIKIMDNHRFILNCIPRFSEAYPEVSISTSHGFFNDHDAVYDLCISSHTSYKNMTGYLPLIKESVILAVHEDHPLAQKKSVEISDLKGERLITLPSQSVLYSLTFDLCRAQGFEPHVPIVCDDPYFIRKYVSENMGIALAPSLSWEGRFRQNTVLIPINNPPVYVTSYILWDNKRYLPPAVVKFRQYLLDEASKLSNNLLLVEK